MIIPAFNSYFGAFDRIAEYSEGPEFEKNLCSAIIKKIEEQQRYASENLLKEFYKIHVDVFHDSNERESWGDSLFHIIEKEYNKLKDDLGYGNI